MNISLRKTNSSEISERAIYRKLGCFPFDEKYPLYLIFILEFYAINFSWMVLLLGNSAVSWLSVNFPRKFSYYLSLFRNIWLNGRRHWSFCVLELDFVYLGYMWSVFVIEQSESLLFAPNIGRKEVKIRIEKNLLSVTLSCLKHLSYERGMRRKVMATH